MASVTMEVYQQHKSLLIKLCDMMDPNDQTYKNFIYYLESYIPKGRLSLVQQNPISVISIMEDTGNLKVGKYQILEKALEASGYINILDILKEEEENIIRQLRQRSYSDGSMDDGSSYIDAATASSIEPEGQHSKTLPKFEKDIQEIKASTSQGAGKMESDISKLRDDLIKAYRNLRCVQVSPILEKRRCDIDKIYIDLVIEERQGGRKTKGGSKDAYTQCKDSQTHSKEPIKVTSYKQLFLDERGLKFQRVYLCGKGGLGKTTFCRKLLHAWCNAHENRITAQDSIFQDEAVLQTFDLLFYMNLREVSSEKTLIEVICTQFPLEEKPNTNVLRTLLKANGDKVLFILDGLDEMIEKPKFLENVVTRRVYPNCCFLVSSRPWKIYQMELHEGTEIDLLLDLKGFSHKNAIKCAEKIFENCYKDGNVIKQFEKDIAKSKLATQLIHVPLLLLFLAQVWYENKKKLPSKLHELYIMILNLLTNRVKEKYRKDPNQRQMRFTLGDMQSPLPSKLSETSLVVNFGEGLLLSFCEVAHHFLLSSQKENSLVFEETKLLNVLGDRGKEKLNIALDIGVLSVTDSVSYLNRNTNVSFLHKTMQEFFTALCFILSPDKLVKFISTIDDLNAVQQHENIIVFLVGLMPELGNHVLEKVNDLCKGDWEVLKNKNEIKDQYRLYRSMIEGTYPFGMGKKKKEICRLCNVSRIYLRCNDNIMGENVLLNVSGLCLNINVFDPHPWNPAFLQCLNLTGGHYTVHTDYVLVNLRGLSGLVYLRLHNLACKLYLPESGFLSIINMITLRLSRCCCDILGRTLTHCTRLEKLAIHKTNLHSCLLDLSNMTKLTVLDMSEVTLSSRCCEVFGSTLTHCTKLEKLKIYHTNFNNCLDLSNVRELTVLKLYDSCCDVLFSPLTHYTKLKKLYMHNTGLQNSLLDLSNMTELTDLVMSGVILSSSFCDILGRTMMHCVKLNRLSIQHTDLHNCLLDLTNMTELTCLNMSSLTMSNTCCDELGNTLSHCTKLKSLDITNTDLHNFVLDLSNIRELRFLFMSETKMASSCCEVLGSTLINCTKLQKLTIHQTDLHNCVLDLSNMTELTKLRMSEVTLSSSCCDVVGSTLTHCTKLEKLRLHHINLHNCLLALSNMTDLTVLDIRELILSSDCCDVLGSTLTYCAKLDQLIIHNTDLHNCLLDVSNMTKLTTLIMSEVTVSSSCCDVLGSTLAHCGYITLLSLENTDLHNFKLDLISMTQLSQLRLNEVTLSSSACQVLEQSLYPPKAGQKRVHVNTYKKLPNENDKWKVKLNAEGLDYFAMTSFSDDDIVLNFNKN